MYMYAYRILVRKQLNLSSIVLRVYEKTTTTTKKKQQQQLKNL